MRNPITLTAALLLVALISGASVWFLTSTQVGAEDTKVVPAKVAGVDFGRLVSENEEHRQARTALVQTLMREMRAEQTKLDADQARIELSMSQVPQGGVRWRNLLQEKFALGEQFIEKQAEFTESEVSKTQDMNLALNDLIQESLAEVCKRRGINLVLNLKFTKLASTDKVDFQVKAFEDVVVWKSDDVPDITDEVLAAMRARQKPTTPVAESDPVAPDAGE
jgi:Skp family chaperone for outer membrane proteins